MVGYKLNNVLLVPEDEWDARLKCRPVHSPHVLQNTVFSMVHEEVTTGCPLPRRTLFS